MERALFVSDIEKLKDEKKGFSRLYFGNEFCEHLLPSLKELDEALDYAEERGMEFTLVTPYATDKAVTRIMALIGRAKKSCEKFEVVINDWGLFRKINGMPAVEPVLGRLLTKQKRGPRLLNILDKTPGAMLDHFRRACADSPAMTAYLSERGIKRLELDNLLQGISRDRQALKASIYTPFSYVTTSRICVTSQAVNGRTFSRNITYCNKECRMCSFTLKHGTMPATLYLKGNTQFIKTETLPKRLEDLNIDRIVSEDGLPM